MYSGSVSPTPRWYWISAIWLGIGLFDATQTVVVMRSEGMHHAWTALFFATLLSWATWALATPFVIRIGNRYPLSRSRPGNWLIHLVTCLATGGVYAAWTAGLERVLNPWTPSAAPGPFLQLWLSKFTNSIVAFSFLYGTILLIGHVLDSRERLARQQMETARLNEQLSQAQLNALRRQIEPHFLFNSLNAIAGLVREGRNDQAVSTIAGLSDFLRRVLEDSSRQEVPLAEEMQFVQKYLDIQKIRFADRLQLSVDVPSELGQAQVPSLILQPMVENAIKHGISKRAQGGEIRIAAFRSDGRLTLSVFNNGPRLAPTVGPLQQGIGISNVRSRLQSLYGDAFCVEMRNQDPEGVQVSVSVPFRER